MFYKSTCGDAFSRWRAGIYNNTVEQTRKCVADTEEMTFNHRELVEKIKDRNCERSEAYLNKKTLHNVWRAWKNVTKWQRNAKHAKSALGENFGSYLIKRAIKKWKQRKDFTHFARDRFLKMKVFNQNLMKRACFMALKTKYQREKGWCVFLGNFANKIDHRAKRSAFQMIENFQLRKKYAYEESKVASTRDFASILNQLYKKKMTQYLSHLRNVSLREKNQEGIKYGLFKHVNTASLRDAFMKWKKQSESLRTV